MLTILRFIFPRLFYKAPWDMPPVYRFARRVGGISHRSLEVL